MKCCKKKKKKKHRQLECAVTDCGDSAVKSETCYLCYNNIWQIDFHSGMEYRHETVMVLIYSHFSDSRTSHPGD